MLGMLACPSFAFGWGREGHAVVAEIAYDQLSAHARKQVLDLLGDPTMVEVSSWADSIGRDQPESKPWHYVDIPVDGKVEHFEETRDGQKGNNVVDKLKEFEKTLGDPNSKKADRTVALKWVIHLVGDIHQPLHCADRAFGGNRGDRGGNDVIVELQPGGRPFNLHSAWDSAILDRELLPPGQEAADYADYLADRLADPTDTALQEKEKHWRAVTDPVAWANESHDLAAAIVYRNIPTTEPSGLSNRPSAIPAATQLVRTTPPTTGPFGFRSRNAGNSAGDHLIQLTPAYMRDAKPVVLEQLEKAGVRLAAVLNRMFP